MTAAASSSKAGPTKLPACGFSVTGSKKGGVPVTVEKRPKGKKVTIVHNVQGSAKSLLAALSSLLGCGGTIREEAKSYFTVEIQGDQVDRVNNALTQLGCLKGVRKDPGDSDKKKRKEVEDVSNRNAGYSKFLRQEGPSTQEKKAEEAKRMEEEYLANIMPLADCYKWHGAWIYCRGRCQQVDFDDVWADATLRGEDRCAPCDVDPQAGEESTGPEAPSSVAELNMMLRDLGMFPEAGAAVMADRAHMNPAKNGISLKDYRRAALAPGARLIDDETTWDKKNSRSYRNQSTAQGARNEVKPRPTPTKPIKLPPAPKVGHYPCIVCGASFSLGKTLKLHMKNTHQGEVYMAERKAKASSTAGASTGGNRMKQWYDVFAEDPEYKVVGDLGRPADPKRTSNLGDWTSNSMGGVLGSAKPQKTKRSETCPFCEKPFPSSEALTEHIEAAHPDAAESSNSSEGRWEEVPQPEEESDEDSSDSDRRHPAVFQVAQDFDPQSDIELRIRSGQKVAVEWRQPRKEGGYWAYGWVVPIDPPRRKGYFPIHALGALLQKKGEASWQAGAAAGASSSSAGPAKVGEETFALDEEEEDGTIREDLLESFMMMDLPKASADLFWAEYGKRKQRMGKDKAWITALEYVCQYLPTQIGMTGGATSSFSTSAESQQQQRELERELERRKKQEQQDRREAEKLQAWERKQQAKRRVQEQQQEWQQSGELQLQPQAQARSAVQQQQQQEKEKEKAEAEAEAKEEAENRRKLEELRELEELQRRQQQEQEEKERQQEEERQWQERQRSRREQQQREEQERRLQREREEQAKREEQRRQEQDRLERERQQQAENRRRVEEFKRQKEREEKEKEEEQRREKERREQQELQQKQQQQNAAKPGLALPQRVKAIRGCRERLIFDVDDWLFVQWVQPPEESGTWAWGRIFDQARNQWSEPEYFPLTCLPPGLYNAQGSTGAGQPSQSQATQPATTQPSAERAATRTSTPAATKVQATGGASSSLTTAATASNSKPAASAVRELAPAPAPAPAPARTTATERATAKTTTTTALSKDKEAKISKNQPKDKIGSKKAPPTLEAAGDRHPPELVPEPATPTEFQETVKVTTMSDKDESWAIGQISKLHQKYGVGRLDPATILASFFVSETISDLRFEAKLHLADNQPVRNFVQQLWTKKQQSS